MRIIVNDIAASKGGALSVLKDFYNYVKENDKENEWIFLLGDKYLEETENIKIITLPHIKKSHIKKLVFDFFTGRKYIKELKPDVVFSLQNIITFGLKIPQVVYIHQAIPFQNTKKFSFFKKNERNSAFIQYFIGAIIKLSAKKAQKIIVQTNWMKDAVAEKSNTDKEKISVVMPNISFVSLENNQTYNFNCFFYPTSNSIYKNNECIEKACEILYGAGTTDFKVELTVNESHHPAIQAIGYIDRSEVFQKYMSSVLIFPSYIETCAFPLIEARRLNSIILSSDCAFSREVLKDYENAYFFNPFKPEELAILMEEVINKKMQRKTDNITFYNDSDSWAKLAEEVIKL